MNAKAARLMQQYGSDSSRIVNAFFIDFLHKLPQLLFISMPFFALILQLLYINRKNRNYVEHFIFSTYHYAYLFLVLSLLIGFDLLIRSASENAANFATGMLTGFVILYILVYLALSMKRFYGGRWRTLVLRYIMLGSMFTILLIFLIILLGVVTAVW
jgi:hypothetical protein